MTKLNYTVMIEEESFGECKIVLVAKSGVQEYNRTIGYLETSTLEVKIYDRLNYKYLGLICNAIESIKKGYCNESK